MSTKKGGEEEKQMKREEEEEGFEIIEKKVGYSRYLTIVEQKVRYPDGRIVDFDVVSKGKTADIQPYFVCVFPFFTKTRTTTLIKEYCWGVNSMQYCLPTGAYESKKHASLLEAAKQELAEEAHLKGGEWIPLFDDKTVGQIGRDGQTTPIGLVEVKWCRTRFFPFLVIDPVKDDNPPELDAEEKIDIIADVSLERLHQLLSRGDLLPHSSTTSYIALSRLNLIQLK